MDGLFSIGRYKTMVAAKRVRYGIIFGMWRAVKYFIILSPFLFSLSPVLIFPRALAQDQLMVVEYESVNPNDGFGYVWKRLGEKIKLSLLFFSTQKKVDYYEKILDSRLAELKYIVDRKDLNNIEKGSWRYSATAGQYADFILKKNLSDSRRGAVDLLKEHLTVVETFQKAFDPTTAEWRLVKQDADYLKIYISQLSN